MFGFLLPGQASGHEGSIDYVVSLRMLDHFDDEIMRHLSVFYHRRALPLLLSRLSSFEPTGLTCVVVSVIV